MDPSAALSTPHATSYPGRARYTAAASERYQRRPPAKHEAEMRLVSRAFRRVPRGATLDVPCGGGRVALLLASQGYRMTCADLSPAMIEIARRHVEEAGLPIRVEQQDVERLRYADGAFDNVISFRLFHHFPTPAIRRAVVGELCRVASGCVALSYFSPWSFTALKRLGQARLRQRPAAKFHTPLREVASYFRENGFRLVRDYAQWRYVHSLHVAVFRRLDARVPAGTASGAPIRGT